MSSILDRLREVEGTTSPREVGADKRLSPGRSPMPPDRGARDWGSRVRVWLCRLFPGVLALLVVLMVWRPWSSQPLAGREGRGLTPAPSPPTPTRRSGDQGSGRIVHESPPAAGAKELSAPPIARADAQPQVEGPGAGDQGSGGTVPEAPPAVAPPVADDAPTKAFLRTLTVTGIYQDAGGYIAFINGRAFQEGDKIEQVEIAEITFGRIAFAHKGKRYILHLR